MDEIRQSLLEKNDGLETLETLIGYLGIPIL